MNARIRQLEMRLKLDQNQRVTEERKEESNSDSTLMQYPSIGGVRVDYGGNSSFGRSKEDQNQIGKSSPILPINSFAHIPSALKLLEPTALKQDGI
mmetsp:Transcript_5825/g.9318  ORF Transcript_5825/g.9318 Transcript_5825/m.9318 type:complete len:96 (-) Transcript_5825:78-365(-)